MTNVDHIENEFTIDTGIRSINVDVNDLGYDPLDDNGYQQIEVGDRVSANGHIRDEIFDTREIAADWVITLDNQNGQ